VQPLGQHPPTNDQLAIIRDNHPGNVLIRGAAGSGKTTSALLRLELVTKYWTDLRAIQGSKDPVRVLALAFNRTLVGYVRDLANAKVGAHPLVQLDVETVAGFNMKVAGFTGDIWDGPTRDRYIWSLGRRHGFSRQFLVDEVEFVIGRFPPGRLSDYVNGPTPRLGRGRTPIVNLDQRRRIYNEVIVPFNQFKDIHGLVDWNDLSVLAAAATPSPASLRHVVVVDEAQDFSVNQMRSVVTHLAPDHSVTIVTDTAQRIYPRYLYYPEAGLPPFQPNRIYTLDRNFRNTPAIAAVAASILSGLTLDADAALPAPSSTTAPSGERPVVITGKYSRQLAWTIERLRQIDLANETAAILTLRGHGAQRATRDALRAADLSFIDLQQKKYWPGGDGNLGLSTLHSAKGLEFDHVFILGLNNEFTQHDDGEDDASLDLWRRLLGMAVGRARKTVTLGYKPQDPSTLIDHVDMSLVDTINVDTTAIGSQAVTP
jgi:superfamily I DNA/RNA helicase